jgi:TPR repeat protein
MRYLIFVFLCAGVMAMEPTAKSTAVFEKTKKNCEQGSAHACARMYYFYVPTRHSYVAGIVPDKKKALYYSQKACDLGDADGCATAAMTIYYGDEEDGIPADRDTGRALYKKACELGKEDICTFFLNKNF